MEKLAVLNSRAPQVSGSRGQAELLRGLRRPNRCRGKPRLGLSGKQGVGNLIKTEQIMGGARNELGDRRSRGQHEQPDADRLEPAAYVPAWGRSPSTTRSRPTLSALVRACNRVSVSGKRSQPTVPARKKNAPAEMAMIVMMSSARLIGPPSIRGHSLPLF